MRVSCLARGQWRAKVLQVWEAQTAEIESALRAAHINAGAPEPLGLITSVRCRIFSDCVLSAQFVTRFILNLHLHEATSILSGPELSLFLLTSAKSAAPLAPASFFLVRRANSREAGFRLFLSGPAGDIRRRRIAVTCRRNGCRAANLLKTPFFRHFVAGRLLNDVLLPDRRP
jgi:hypothetical protein